MRVDAVASSQLPLWDVVVVVVVVVDVVVHDRRYLKTKENWCKMMEFNFHAHPSLLLALCVLREHLRVTCFYLPKLDMFCKKRHGSFSS
jgi:hypothetical protein